MLVYRRTTSALLKLIEGMEKINILVLHYSFLFQYYAMCCDHIFQTCVTTESFQVLHIVPGCNAFLTRDEQVLLNE